MKNKQIAQWVENIKNGYLPTIEEINYLKDYPDLEEVCEGADLIRQHYSGKNFDLCSLINAKSGKCPENCKWCSQSAHNDTGVQVYDMIDKNEAVRLAKENEAYGVKRFSLVTASKAVSDKALDKLIDIYEDIKKEVKINFCASMGLVRKDQLQRLKDVGVEHYHCNLETSETHFPNVCTTHTYQDKIRTIQWAKEVGLKICSGGIFGMGETIDDRIAMAFELRRLEVKSIPINILTPVAGTGFADAQLLDDDEILRSMALFRYINPDASIRFAGGRIKIKHLQTKALHSGINSALVGNLLTTLGTSVEEDIDSFRKEGFVC